jgi:FkbM family methyltransferase
VVAQSKYYLEIRTKTRLFNAIRRGLANTLAEELLLSWVKKLVTPDLWSRLIPPNYLYRKGSFRRIERNGVCYELDLSECVDHGVYFDYLEPAQRRLFQLVRDRAVIFDVGVNIGSFLLNFAQLSPNGQVFGFEPDVRNFERAVNNLELNDFSNVTLIRKALGSAPGTATMLMVNENNAGMNRIRIDESNIPDSKITCEVEIIRLDDFVESEKLKSLDLIKIDVEGFELNVLKGAQHSLRKFRPILFIELDDDNLHEQGNSAKELIEFLEREGYGCQRADNGKDLTVNDDFSDCHFDIICESIRRPSMYI